MVYSCKLEVKRRMFKPIRSFSPDKGVAISPFNWTLFLVKINNTG